MLNATGPKACKTHDTMTLKPYMTEGEIAKTREAAALVPELVAALEDVMSRLVDRHEQDEAAVQARAAITKAKSQPLPDPLSEIQAMREAIKEARHILNNIAKLSHSPSFRPRHHPPDCEGVWFARGGLGNVRMIVVESKSGCLGANHPKLGTWEPLHFPDDQAWDGVSEWYGPVIPANFDPWANSALNETAEVLNLSMCMMVTERQSLTALAKLQPFIKP